MLTFMEDSTYTQNKKTHTQWSKLWYLWKVILLLVFDWFFYEIISTIKPLKALFIALIYIITNVLSEDPRNRNTTPVGNRY